MFTHNIYFIVISSYFIDKYCKKARLLKVSGNILQLIMRVVYE